VECTADFGNHSARSLTKEADSVFHNPATFDTAIHMLAPYAPSRKLLVKCFLLAGK